jgi:hypothetical protein
MNSGPKPHCHETWIWIKAAYIGMLLPEARPLIGVEHQIKQNKPAATTHLESRQTCECLRATMRP